MALAQKDRDRLNDIIGRMKDNNESDDSIREMVGQYKSKYDVADTAMSGGGGESISAPKDPTLYEALSPRGSQSRGEVGGARQFANEATDALSLGGRMVASIPAILPGGETFPQAVSRTRAKESTGQPGRFISNVLRDPATAAAAPFAALAPGAGGVLGKLGQAAAIGLGEGAASAGAHQLERYGQTGKVDLNDAAMEIGLSGVAAGGMAGLGMLGGKARDLAKPAVASFTGISQDALEEASNPARLAAAKKSGATYKGNLLTVASDVQDDVFKKRGEIDRIAQQFEDVKAKAFGQDVAGGKTKKDILPGEFGENLRETTKKAREGSWKEFKGQEDEIFGDYAADDWQLGDQISKTEAQHAVDRIFEGYKHDPNLKAYIKGHTPIPEEAFSILNSLRDRFKSANNVGELIEARRLVDRMVDFDADTGNLFRSSEGANSLLKQLRTNLNDVVDETLSSIDPETAKMWRANNARSSMVIDALKTVDKSIRPIAGDTDKTMGKISNMGLDKLTKVANVASKDTSVKPVWDELKRGYFDDILLDSMGDNGIDFAKFKKVWDKSGVEKNRLMLGPERVAQIEDALKKYAPQKVEPSTFGEGVVGSSRNPQYTASKLENIGSKQQRTVREQLAFLDAALGTNVSQIADDAYLAKQLGIDETGGDLGVISRIKTGKINAGMPIGVGIASGAAGFLSGDDEKAKRSGVTLAAGALLGLYLQSPSAALAMTKALNADSFWSVVSKAGGATGKAIRAGARSSQYGTDYGTDSQAAPTDATSIDLNKYGNRLR
jgi:hypothetical protein